MPVKCTLRNGYGGEHCVVYFIPVENSNQDLTVTRLSLHCEKGRRFFSSFPISHQLTVQILNTGFPLPLLPSVTGNPGTTWGHRQCPPPSVLWANGHGELWLTLQPPRLGEHIPHNHLEGLHFFLTVLSHPWGLAALLGLLAQLPEGRAVDSDTG